MTLHNLQNDSDDLVPAYRSDCKAPILNEAMIKLQYFTDDEQITTTDQDSKNNPFHFLDLAAELRNSVYAFTLENYPNPQLLLEHDGGYCITDCPLVYVSKQVSAEFRYIRRYIRSDDSIHTTVSSLDFSQLMAYINKLPGDKFQWLTKRGMTIMLDVDDFEAWREWRAGYLGWKSWVLSMSRGIAMDFSYAWVGDTEDIPARCFPWVQDLRERERTKRQEHE